MIATSSGTLIVAIPCKDGLVISADKKEVIRAPDGYAITRYDAVKIRRLGRFAAFGATGWPIIYNIIDRRYDSVEPIYDAREAVELFYSGTGTGFTPLAWDELGAYLENHFNEFHSRCSCSPLRHACSGWLYRLPFWYVTDDGELGSTEIKMKYVKERQCVEYFLGEALTQDRFQIAEAVLYSHTSVIEKIKSTSDVEFDKYRTDHTIMRFLKNPPLTSDVETDEAKAASKKLIAITSETIYDVGPASDSILLHKQKGILSLDRDPTNLPQ